VADLQIDYENYEKMSDRIKGHEAIQAARATGRMLSMYTSPIQEGREGLTVAEAEEVAEQDPGLIYLDVSSPRVNGVTLVRDTETDAAYVSREAVPADVAAAAVATLRAQGWTVSTSRCDELDERSETPTHQWIWVGWKGTAEPAWWDAARALADSLRDPSFTRIFNALDRGDVVGDDVLRGELDAFLESAQRLPGWDDGDKHAPHPVMWTP